MTKEAMIAKLNQIMDEIGEEALSNSLAPNILNSIMSDDK